jgi:hypothetical protein
MQDTNWELVKFKYEFLGFSLEDLAREHDISTAVLEYSSKNWSQVSLGQDDLVGMEDIKSIDDVLKKLSKQTINQSQAFQILKQKFLGSKYIELETTLLHKAVQIATNLDEKDYRAASTLKSLTETLVNLINQNPLLKSWESGDDESSDKVWEVRVVSAKPDKGKEATET